MKASTDHRAAFPVIGCKRMTLTVVTIAAGSGRTDEDPCRHITAYFDDNGVRLAVVDPLDLAVKA